MADILLSPSSFKPRDLAICALWLLDGAKLEMEGKQVFYRRRLRDFTLTVGVASAGALTVTVEFGVRGVIATVRWPNGPLPKNLGPLETFDQATMVVADEVPPSLWWPRLAGLALAARTLDQVSRPEGVKLS